MRLASLQSRILGLFLLVIVAVQAGGFVLVNSAGGAAARNTIGEDLVAAQGLLAQTDAGGAEFQRRGGDRHSVVEPRRGEIANVEPGHGVEPRAVVDRAALLDPEHAQQVRAGTFEPAQVVGVIDHAGAVGVLEIDAHRQHMGLALDPAREIRPLVLHPSSLPLNSGNCAG